MFSRFAVLEEEVVKELCRRHCDLNFNGENLMTGNFEGVIVSRKRC